MAQTPEGRVKDKIDKVLKWFKPELYFFKPVQTGYGAPSLDYLCAYRGKAFAIEAKARGGVPTKRQEITITQMEAAGVKVFIIDGDKGVEILNQWLTTLPSHQNIEK